MVRLYFRLILYTQDGPPYNHTGYTQDRLVNSDKHPKCVIYKTVLRITKMVIRRTVT